MKTRDVSILKRLPKQLIVLLFSLLLIALPSISDAVSLETQSDETSISSSKNISYAFASGEVTSGEPKAVLQLDKEQVAKLFPALLLRLYPILDNCPIIPTFYSFSKQNCGHNSILTKGP